MNIQRWPHGSAAAWRRPTGTSSGPRRISAPEDRVDLRAVLVPVVQGLGDQHSRPDLVQLTGLHVYGSDDAFRIERARRELVPERGPVLGHAQQLGQVVHVLGARLRAW